MKDNRNYLFNNKIKTLLIIIILLECILMFFLIYQYKKINKSNNIPLSSSNSSENVFGFENAQTLLSVTLKSENLSAGEISKNIEYFATKAIPFMDKNILSNDSNNITELYKENIEMLLNNAGIKSEKELIDMCNKLKNIDCNLSQLSSASYISDTVDYNNDIFKINIKLKDKNQKYITIKLIYNPDDNVHYRYEIIE